MDAKCVHAPKLSNFRNRCPEMDEGTRRTIRSRLEKICIQSSDEVDAGNRQAAQSPIIGQKKIDTRLGAEAR